jgi:hypothetical protein
MANFVMSLASSPSVSYPVELSASPFCHYHYSNLTKVLRQWQVRESDFRSFIRQFMPGPRFFGEGVRYYALTHDVTKMLKAHSPCLEGRQYVPTSNNVIASNRALGVGYPVSALHLGAGQAGWCPPLALDRLGPQEDSNAVAVKQIESLLRDKTLPFGQELCLLRGDSSYGKAIFLAPLYDLGQLVLIVRLRPGMKVWAKAPDEEPTGGATRIYGDKFYLTDTSEWKTYRKKGVPYQVWQESLCEQPADEHLEKETVLGNDRRVVLDIRRWNNLLIRTKKGASMKDKPLDVLRVQVLDAESRQAIFDRPLFVAVSGKRKNQVDSALAQEQYRERYDVEPYYRFAKNQLLMDKLQTPDAKHLDPWLRIVQITSWLLFTARQEIGQICCPVWQKYLPKNKAAQDQPLQPLTIAQTQRAAHLLFCTFDPAPFLPLKCKKGKGRQKGQTLPQRTRFKVVKKIKKSIRKLKNQQNE